LLYQESFDMILVTNPSYQVGVSHVTVLAHNPAARREGVHGVVGLAVSDSDKGRRGWRPVVEPGVGWGGQCDAAAEAPPHHWLADYHRQWWWHPELGVRVVGGSSGTPR
jgi:hypothetical protein